MTAPQLITPLDLATVAEAGETVIFDSRFDLLRPDAGRAAWRRAHIPGAVYADLERDLSAPVAAGTGRHPLPGAASFARFLARSGWREGCRSVAYDDQGGACAARFWWLMKYFGLGNTQVLDGGIDAWRNSGLPVEGGDTPVAVRNAPKLAPRPELVLDTPAVARGLEAGSILLLDARDQHRFAGLAEPIDPVAGHIPGARNHPYARNLDAEQCFKQPAELAAMFAPLVQQAGPHVVHMCGSGVTACHNLLAMEIAGLESGLLYAGSWSAWITDPARPVAAGQAASRDHG